MELGISYPTLDAWCKISQHSFSPIIPWRRSRSPFGPFLTLSWKVRRSEGGANYPTRRWTRIPPHKLTLYVQLNDRTLQMNIATAPLTSTPLSSTSSSSPSCTHPWPWTRPMFVLNIFIILIRSNFLFRSAAFFMCCVVVVLRDREQVLSRCTTGTSGGIFFPIPVTGSRGRISSSLLEFICKT